MAIFNAYAADPVATRYLSWPVRKDPDEVEAWLAPKVAAWDAGTEFRWVLAERPDGAAFGTVSLRASDVGFELGYALGRDHAGRGIATAAVHRMLQVSADLIAPVDVIACTDPENRASVRVLDKCGFTLLRNRHASAVRPGMGPEPRDTLAFRRRVTA